MEASSAALQELAKEFVRVGKQVSEFGFRFVFYFTVLTRLTLKFHIRQYVDSFTVISEEEILSQDHLAGSMLLHNEELL